MITDSELVLPMCLELRTESITILSTESRNNCSEHTLFCLTKAVSQIIDIIINNIKKIGMSADWRIRERHRDVARQAKQDIVSRTHAREASLRKHRPQNVHRYQFTFLLRPLQKKHGPIGSLACQYRVPCSSKASSTVQRPLEIEKGRWKEGRSKTNTAAVTTTSYY